MRTIQYPSPYNTALPWSRNVPSSSSSSRNLNCRGFGIAVSCLGCQFSYLHLPLSITLHGRVLYAIRSLLPMRQTILSQSFRNYILIPFDRSL